MNHCLLKHLQLDPRKQKFFCASGFLNGFQDGNFIAKLIIIIIWLRYIRVEYKLLKPVVADTWVRTLFWQVVIETPTVVIRPCRSSENFFFFLNVKLRNAWQFFCYKATFHSEKGLKYSISSNSYLENNSAVVSKLQIKLKKMFLLPTTYLNKTFAKLFTKSFDHWAMSKKILQLLHNRIPQRQKKSK